MYKAEWYGHEGLWRGVDDVELAPLQMAKLSMTVDNTVDAEGGGLPISA